MSHFLKYIEEYMGYHYFGDLGKISQDIPTIFGSSP